MSLLDRSALYFARPDRLGDPFEGSFGRLNLLPGPQPVDREAIEALKRAVEAGGLEAGLQAVEETTEGEKKRRWIRRFIYEYVMKAACVNCWHINDFESAAMWNVYSRIGDGIAVQSTYDRLRDGFVRTPPYHIEIGTV